MIEREVAAGIAIFSGMGILAAALALYRVGRPSASPPWTGRESVADSPVPHVVARNAVTSPSPPLAAQIVTVRPQIVVSPGSPVRIEPRTPGPRDPESGRVIVVVPTAGSSTPARRPILLRPVNRPYWDLTHWREDGDCLTGFYRTPWGSFDGYVRHAKGERPEFYIAQPPAALWKHKHAICFRDTGQKTNTYSIHFSPAPRDPDTGILAVEKVLGEALAQERRSHA